MKVLINNYLINLSKINDKITLLDKLSSLILSIFIITPIVLIDVNLLYLYYDAEILLIIILILCFNILVLLYTKFNIVIYKKNTNDISKFTNLYIINVILSLFISIIIFIIYIIARR